MFVLTAFPRQHLNTETLKYIAIKMLSRHATAFSLLELEVVAIQTPSTSKQ